MVNRVNKIKFVEHDLIRERMKSSVRAIYVVVVVIFLYTGESVER